MMVAVPMPAPTQSVISAVDLSRLCPAALAGAQAAPLVPGRQVASKRTTHARGSPVSAHPCLKTELGNKMPEPKEVGMGHMRAL